MSQYVIVFRFDSRSCIADTEDSPKITGNQSLTRRGVRWIDRMQDENEPVSLTLKRWRKTPASAANDSRKAVASTSERMLTTILSKMSYVSGEGYSLSSPTLRFASLHRTATLTLHGSGGRIGYGYMLYGLTRFLPIIHCIHRYHIHWAFSLPNTPITRIIRMRKMHGSKRKMSMHSGYTTSRIVASRRWFS